LLEESMPVILSSRTGFTVMLVVYDLVVIFRNDLRSEWRESWESGIGKMHVSI
jgi:hypothetical protein